MKIHEILKKYILGLDKNLANSLIVISPAGRGKTSTTLETLKELNYQEGTHFLYISNYITPIELYLLLEKVNNLQNPRILIIDDGEDSLSNPRAIGLLKGALFASGSERKVSWHSQTYRIKNKEFIFNGKIIFLLNQINNKSPLINALKDRSLVLDLEMSQEELFVLMEERAEHPEPIYQKIPLQKRREIISYIKKVGKNSQKISLRTLSKVFNLFILSPSHWQILAERII